jgi:hypothetical protein
MSAIRPVTVDLATGVVTIGGTRVALERAGAYFTAPGGFRARALTFAERSSIVAGALIDPEPHRSLLTKLRALAAPAYDKTDDVTDALILALAGGGEAAAPFSDCAREACRKRDSDWQTVQQAPAVLVDQIASEKGSADDETGWTRFEFREAGQDSVSAEDCCRLMLEQLLERGTPQGESASERSNVASEGSSAVHNLGDRLSDNDGSASTGQLPDDIPQRPIAAWPRAAQSPRLRAMLPASDEASPKPVTAKEKPASTGGTLRSGSEWPKQSLQQAVDAAPDPRAELFTQASLPVPEKHTDYAAVPSDSTQKSTTTLWDAVTAPTAAISSAAVSAASAQSKSAAGPPKARLRAHRLRDLPLRPAETARALAPAELSLASAMPLTPTTSETPLNDKTVVAVAPQRDWLYEIATALADECDLRGLDA